MILVHPLIDPVILSFGFLQIRWYGLAYVLGFLIGLYLIKNERIWGWGIGRYCAVHPILMEAKLVTQHSFV